MEYSNAEKINQDAITALEKQDFHIAQDLFRKNVKENRGFISLNNMGVFYFHEGMELKNGKTRCANKLSLRFLLAAEKYKHSYANNMALGTWFFEEGEHKTAEGYFRQACSLTPSCSGYNNLGATLYLQREYSEASLYLGKACSLCEGTDMIEKVYPSYLFSLIKSKKKKKALSVLHQILSENVTELETAMSLKQDVFIVSYLCNDMQFAEKQIENMLSVYSVDNTIMAMVFDCLIKVGKENEIGKYLRHQIEHLEGFDFNRNAEIERIKKISKHASLRERDISEYSYFPSTITECCYIGCTKHNVDIGFVL